MCVKSQMCPNAQTLISLSNHFVYTLRMGEQSFVDNSFFVVGLLAYMFVYLIDSNGGLRRKSAIHSGVKDPIQRIVRACTSECRGHQRLVVGGNAFGRKL